MIRSKKIKAKLPAGPETLSADRRDHCEPRAARSGMSAPCTGHLEPLARGWPLPIGRIVSTAICTPQPTPLSAWLAASRCRSRVAVESPLPGRVVKKFTLNLEQIPRQASFLRSVAGPSCAAPTASAIGKIVNDFTSSRGRQRGSRGYSRRSRIKIGIQLQRPPRGLSYHSIVKNITLLLILSRLSALPARERRNYVAGRVNRVKYRKIRKNTSGWTKEDKARCYSAAVRAIPIRPK